MELNSDVLKQIKEFVENYNAHQPSTITIVFMILTSLSGVLFALFKVVKMVLKTKKQEKNINFLGKQIINKDSTFAKEPKTQEELTNELMSLKKKVKILNEIIKIQLENSNIEKSKKEEFIRFMEIIEKF